MKICFFGASVTQQKTGYVVEYKKINPEHKIGQFGYGSMHLNDAGMCLINNVIDFEPNICFIEWFSTGYVNEWCDTYIENIIYKFTQNRCKICFLFLYRNDIDEKRIKMFDRVKMIANKYGVKYLDITHLNDITYLRDTVHTTDVGSVTYAKEIAKLNLEDLTFPSVVPNKNKYSDINILQINKKINADDEIIIQINDDQTEIIGIYQKIGPFSCKISIQDKNKKEIIQVWDQWCHFERDNIKCSFKGFSGKTVLKLSDCPIDRSGCKDDKDWDNVEKYLDIHCIFYIGGNIQHVTSLHDK